MAFNTSLICKINARKAVKRLISFVTASSMLFSGIANNIDNNKISAATTETTAKIYGDVTKDGKLDILDSISLTNYVLNSNKPISSNFDVSAADLDGDGVVNTIDVILMKYFITNSIDIFPIEATVDSDGDGLSDYIEKNITKTDPKLKDTDSDGLSDGEEMVVTNTNPLLKDTDSNGINDGDEDPDKDGLKNIDEIKYITNPLVEDTDEDGLNDGDEINKHKTNPLVEDTDEDGLDDYEEIILGLNPLNKASKGVADNLYTLEQTVKADNEILKDINKAGSPYSFSATGKVAGLMERRLSVRKSGYTNVLQSDSIVGDILDISYDENVKMEKMNIQFKIENCKNYYIFKYNKEVNMLFPCITEYNEEENILYASNVEMGTYAVVDILKFADDMGLNESSEEIILSKDNVLATTEDLPDNIISYKPIDLVFALHSRDSDIDHYYKNIESIKSISEHVLSCMPNARIAIVDFNEHREHSTNAWIGECKYLTNDKGDIWVNTNDEIKQMLAQSKFITISGTYWKTDYKQAYGKIVALDYRTSTNRYVVSLNIGALTVDSGGNPSMLSDKGYKVVDVGERWENDVNKIGERMDKIVIQNGGIVKDMPYLGLVDLEEVKTYITGRYASGMFGESVKLKRKLTAEDFEVYNKWVSGAISKSDFSKYNLTDSDGDGLYDIEEIDMRFVRMENGVVYLPTIMDLINKTSNYDSWSRFSTAVKYHGKDVSNVEKKNVIPYISNPDKVDGDDDKIPDLDDEKPSEYTSLPNYFIVYDPDRPFIYINEVTDLPTTQRTDFLRQGEWMRKYAYDNKNCETIIVKGREEFVDAWNQIPKYAGNIHLFLHGSQHELNFAGGEIQAQDLIGAESDEYCIDDKIIQNKVYLYACHGGDENHLHGSTAQSFALKINGASVIAARDDSVNYANFEIKIDKELDDLAITGNELVDAYVKLQLKINLNITLNIYDRFELYPILQNGEKGIGTWIEVYYNKVYEILQTKILGKKWRL